MGGLGCGSGGSGVVPLGGGARRASIFDRIADVVFSEEQKEQNPVDAVAVRSVRIDSVGFDLCGFELSLSGFELICMYVLMCPGYRTRPH